MKSLRYIFSLVVLLLSSIIGFAQNTPDNADFVKAYGYISKGSTDSAKIFIDKAMADSAVRKNATGWYVRGFIYKELYKKYEVSSKLKSAYRDTAVKALLTSILLDTSATNKKACLPTLKFIAGTYYNDASALMDSLHYITAINYYGKYRNISIKTDPSANLNAMDIAFDLKLGEVYSYLFFHAATDKQKGVFLDSAKKSYNAVLAINPNDVSANYNLAILYYNQAVYIINQMDYDADLSKLNAAQDTSVHLAMQSLPFMQKTYQLDPKKKDAVKGLEGIYYLLHDTQKFEEYEQKLKELEGGN
ncbi:MAG TPA: hypothetical protein VNZ45_16475 [Bacteroidia bacterium]|jgi:hypothetical protein|nr:hypothetical protein [Bacteroidia bacterium]